MDYELLMKQALILAESGRGKTHPNPLVGAVIVDDDANILAQGYHERAGENHAEINALEDLSSKAMTSAGKTMIVTLEPCNHHGKTPPCADAIIKAGIKRVVIGAADTNNKVAGKGAEKLRKAGIEVIEGILEEECRKQNRAFFSGIERGRPWVIAKWAMSLDGKIATKSGDSFWISSDESRELARDLRAFAGAVLVGSGTILKDNPKLNYRGEKDYKQPVKIILDPSSKTSFDFTVYGDFGAKVIYVRSSKEGNPHEYQIENHPKLDHLYELSVNMGIFLNLKLLLEILYKEFELNSIIVEGGARTITTFHESRLIDEYNVFISPKIIGGEGALSPIIGQGIESMNDVTKLQQPEMKIINEQDVFIRGFASSDFFKPIKKGTP